MNTMIAPFILLLSSLVNFGSGQSCNELITKYGRVCVCNSTYCDIVQNFTVNQGQFQIISTSSAKLGFTGVSGTISSSSNTSNPQIIIKVDQNTKYQKILGFGGAFTDSAGININSLPKAAQTNLLKSYFGANGIQYSLCRVPVGGTDMSTRAYSYDDTANDVELKNFALQPEDINYKIPFIQQAFNLTGNNLKLFATAWTAPPWMKTNDNWSGTGFLKTEYFQVWANYYIKFFQAYSQHGINFWGMTAQNEPIDGYFPSFLSPLNAMGWTTDTMNTWIGKNLGPTIKSSEFKDLKIIVHDDNRLTLPFLSQLLNNNLTMQYIDGVGMHWYTDNLPAFLLDNAKSSKKNWFILGTEACNGAFSSFGLGIPVTLGSWERADAYIVDIIDNMDYGYAGWVDWNMVMDPTGGPTYIKNHLDSPIIVNNKTGEFYKQPMFYALGHFSKYVVPDSVRVDAKITKQSGDVKTRAFVRPDGSKVVTIHNRESQSKTVQIQTGQGVLDVTIQAKSLNTVLYK